MAFQLPTDLAIVGIGGCGKRLVEEICKHKWFLQQYGKDGKHLRIYTMDTDAIEKSFDDSQKKHIGSRLEDLGYRGNIEYDSLYLPSLANITQPSDLASRDVARMIKERKAEPKVTTWWINDDVEGGISFDDLKKIDPFTIEDFGGGVHRRRAISKAIFYKIISQGQAVGFPTFPGIRTIAIIVGLGGGTGSGMFIDLARYIRGLQGEGIQIWLFGVLPTTREGEKEQLNAAIALSELEYLSVNERLFNYMILTSLGPTGFRKGEEARTEVEEFDTVFPYIFTNFFHIERSDINIGDAKKPFSSFIFADAHLIQLLVEELRQIKTRYHEAIDTIQNVTDLRKDLNTKISKFLETNSVPDYYKPTKDDFDYLMNELTVIEKLWMNRVGAELQYQTPEVITWHIDNNVATKIRRDKITEYSVLLDYISETSKFLPYIKDDKFRDEYDRKLSRVIFDSLVALHENGRLLPMIASNQEEKLQIFTKELLKGKENIQAQLREVNQIGSTAKDEKGKIEQELIGYQQQLKELEKLKDKAAQSVTTFLADIDRDIENFVVNGTRVNSIKEKERTLKQKLDTFIAKVKTHQIKAGNKELWHRSGGVPEIQQDIDQLSTELGQNLQGLKDFVVAVSEYYWYDNRLRLLEKTSLSQKFINFITGKKDKIKRQFDAQKKDREGRVRSLARNWNIAINSPFEPIIPENFLASKIQNQADEYQNQISSIIKKEYYSEDINEKLDTIFKSTDRIKIREDLRELLIKNYLTREDYFKNFETIESNTIKANENLEKKTQLLSVVNNTVTLNEETGVLRRDLSKKYEKFTTTFRSIEDIQPGSKKYKGMYLTKLNPADSTVLSLVDEETNLGTFDNNAFGNQQLDNLVTEIRSNYKMLIDNYKLGVLNLMIPIGTTERWNFGKLGLAIGSNSAYISKKMTTGELGGNIAQDINDTFALKNINDMRIITHNYANNWDISLTLYAATSFIDNIAPLAAGGGYWEIYEHNKSNLLHHVVFLHRGEYLVRERRMELSEAGVLANEEKKNANVGDSINKLYKVKKLKEALSDEIKK